MLKVLAVTGYKGHELGIFNNKHPGGPLHKKSTKTTINWIQRRRVRMGGY